MRLTAGTLPRATTTDTDPDESSHADRSVPVMTRSRTIVLVLGGSIDRRDIPLLCERAAALLAADGADLVVCDVAALDSANAVVVDALARLQLTARRLGRRVLIRDACGELRDLLALVGLGDVLPCGPASGVETSGQAEEREQALRVEEEADPGDPPA
jgi:anti-anti-sigma regulatory factor